MKKPTVEALREWALARMHTKRSGIAAIVEIAVGLILFATLGFVALTMLQTSSTSGWSSSVATVAVTVVGILAAIAVALTFYHYAKQASTF